MGTGSTSKSSKSRNTGVRSNIKTVDTSTLKSMLSSYAHTKNYLGEHYNDFDTGPDITDRQKASLYDWSGASNACRYMRAAGRGESVPQKYADAFNDIEQFISKNPGQFKNVTLFRGVPADRYWDDMKTWKIGTVINQRGNSSWTTALTVAENFADAHPSAEHKANIIFVEPKGSSRARSIVGHSAYALESEALQSATTSQKITKIVKGKLSSYDKVETWIVEVEEVFKKR